MAISAIKAIVNDHEIIRGILCSETADVPTNISDIAENSDEGIAGIFLKLGDWIVDAEASKSYYISEVAEDGTITTQQFGAWA